ncbi:MAG: hypothetical protein V4547_17790 [Bacteroidota bacterium]
MTLIVKRRRDGFAEPEIEDVIDNCSDGLQHFNIMKQNSSVFGNPNTADSDFEFGNGEFESSFVGDGEDMSYARGPLKGLKARRATKLKMKAKRQDARINLKNAKASAKITKAKAKLGKAGAKVTAAKAQVASAKALGKQSTATPTVDTTVINDAPEPTGMSKNMKTGLAIGGGLLLLALGFLAYKKFKKK